MAQDNNVTNFPTPPEQPVKLADEWIFKMVQQWKIARAKQAISWAEHNKATLGGLGSEAELDTTALDEMQTIEFHLGSFVPGTVLTARAMLEMAIDILAYHGIDPEHVFATGPVLDIVRNCLTAFETLDGLQTLTSTRAR